MNDKTEIWVMPESKILLVDRYGAPPVEACNWPESTKNYIQALGLTSALHEFNSWEAALDFAQQFCKEHPDWRYECSSPEGDLAAAVSAGEQYYDEEDDEDYFRW